MMKRSNKIWAAVLGAAMTIGILSATIGPKYWKHRVNHFHKCYMHYDCSDEGPGE